MRHMIVWDVEESEETPAQMNRNLMWESYRDINNQVSLLLHISYMILTSCIKGIVHWKIHASSTHHYADGGAGEVFKSTKHFWILWGKLC